MARFTPTGVHRQQIADVHPKKGAKLPPDDHFHSFFSKFGSILEVYHHATTKKGVEHVYVVFKTNDAIPKFKQYWSSKTTTGSWKDSCNIITNISNAPRELMDRISPQLAESSSSKDSAPSVPQEDAESSKVVDTEDGEIVESSISGEQSSSSTKPSKRKRDEPATEHPPKKKRPLEEPESNESGSSTDSLPANPPEDSSTPADESSIKHMKKEPRTPRLSPTPPALEFARQAAILAAKARKRSQQTKAANDVISELERLKAERDEARAERDALKVELDEAVVQRDAAMEANRQSQRELQELKSSIEDRDEKTDEVLSLVTASLHSLQRKPRRGGE